MQLQLIELSFICALSVTSWHVNCSRQKLWPNKIFVLVSIICHITFTNHFTRLGKLAAHPSLTHLRLSADKRISISISERPHMTLSANKKLASNLPSSAGYLWCANIISCPAWQNRLWEREAEKPLHFRSKAGFPTPPPSKCPMERKLKIKLGYKNLG